VIRYVDSETGRRVTGRYEGTCYYIVWPYYAGRDGHWGNPERTMVATVRLQAPDLLSIDYGDRGEWCIVAYQRSPKQTGHAIRR
jgi:hypothetical protein